MWDPLDAVFKWAFRNWAYCFGTLLQSLFILSNLFPESKIHFYDIFALKGKIIARKILNP